MASDEEFTSFGGDWDGQKEVKPKNKKLGTVETIEYQIKQIKDTLKLRDTLKTDVRKDKYTIMGLKNDIAYKYEQIEAIRKKYPEYFI